MNHSKYNNKNNNKKELVDHQLKIKKREIKNGFESHGSKTKDNY